MFATDRDLLVLEPGLLGTVAWLGQRLVSGIGSVSGAALLLTSYDNSMQVQGVGPGSIIRIGGTGYEIVSVNSDSTATVSRLRASADGSVLMLSTMAGVEVEVYTFAAQLADVHRRVLAMLGLRAAGEAGGGELDESAVTNPGDLSRLEALGVLHLIYAGASAGLADDSPAASRAEMYRSRFAAERGRVIARIDTDGDGVADVARRPGLGRLVRG